MRLINREQAQDAFIGYDEYNFAYYVLDEVPTVEAIPKADYENRLKADMVAILTDLQLEIEEQKFDNHIDKDTWNNAISVCSEVIQDKINELKGEAK